MNYHRKFLLTYSIAQKGHEIGQQSAHIKKQQQQQKKNQLPLKQGVCQNPEELWKVMLALVFACKTIPIVMNFIGNAKLGGKGLECADLVMEMQA